MRSVESQGKTVEQAVEAGLAELGTARDKVSIEVISQGGLFRKATVRLTMEDTEGARAFAFVEGLIEKLGLTAKAELAENDERVKIDISGVDVGAIIGHRGEVLDAVQYLASLIANKGEEEKYKRVVVDGEGYREKRTAALEELADRLAEKAVAQQRSLSAEPMNPYERRIIHARLQTNEAVTTHSEGSEPNRYLVVTPKGVTPGGHKTYPAFERSSGGRNGGGGYGRGGNSGNRGGGQRGVYNSGRGGRNDGGGYGGGRGGNRNDNRGRGNSGGGRGGGRSGGYGGGRDYDEGLPPEKYGDAPANGQANAQYSNQQRGNSGNGQQRPQGGGGQRQQFAFRSSNKKPSPYSRLSGFSDDSSPRPSGFSDDALKGKSNSKFTKD